MLCVRVCVSRETRVRPHSDLEHTSPPLSLTRATPVAASPPPPPAPPRERLSRPKLPPRHRALPSPLLLHSSLLLAHGGRETHSRTLLTVHARSLARSTRYRTRAREREKENERERERERERRERESEREI